MALKTKLDHLLSSNLSDSELESELEKLEETYARDFQKVDGGWALKLYDRSPTLFGEFIGKHLNDPKTIEVLLPRLEQDEQTSWFTVLYHKIATPERYNADVLRLIETCDNFETLYQAISRRRGNWSKIREDVLIALYQRDPHAFEAQLLNHFRYSYRHLFEIPSGNLKNFRRAVSEANATAEMEAMLFRTYATQEEWEAKIRELIENPPVNDNISKVLTEYHPDAVARELPLELIGQLIETFGEAALDYLAKKVNWFIMQTVETLIRLEQDEEGFSKTLYEIHNTAGAPRFQSLADQWGQLLYERDPLLLDGWVKHHIIHNHRAIHQLLPKLRRDGHYEIYRSLYTRVVTADGWNAELLSLARSRMTVGELERELVRLDLHQNRYDNYVTIYDTTAAALYRRSPDAFREFVWRYIIAGKRDYPELREAIKAAGDKEFLNRLFRKVSSPEAWNEEMQHLLDQDVPAERIIEELEKRKPTRTQTIKPHMLTRFMQKYGEAVMPFFETYIDWTSPKRLKALLDLGLERGELLRELQAIARRQPVEFSEKAEVWAGRLYEMSPVFFGAFIIRNLAWNAQKVGKQLLKKMEDDGHDNLFAELYPRFTRGDEWQRDIARLVDKKMDDETLHKALMRRTRAWGVLSDDVAATIYERNPDLFREFLQAHVGQMWGNNKYSRLEKAAKKRGDSEMLALVAEKVDPQKSHDQQLDRLLKENIPADEIVGALQKAMPKETWRVQDVSKYLKFIEKYGDAVMPFILNNMAYRYYFSQSDFIKAVRKHASEVNYWKFVFATNNTGEWNKALKALANKNLPADHFRAELAVLSPTLTNQWHRWWVDQETAVKLYKQHPTIARPFLERFLEDVPLELFMLAHKNQDEDFLDYLTYRLMRIIQSLRYQATNSYWGKKDKETAQKRMLELEAVVTQRLNRLYTESPDNFIRHAANILSLVPPFERWEDARSDGTRIFDLLAGRYHDNWKRSPAAIKELMESPNIFVQIAGMNILSGGGLDAAERVMENLQAFRVLLLSDCRISTKRLALKCLTVTTDASPEAADARILPMLTDTMNYFARNAIPDEIAVLYVRLVHEQENIPLPL